ncbi:MAG: indolepyruvate ferredoxin oxidoreductase [Phycisphaerae bacterium]|nr:indolepyruvate ferredoxin oxidoreductase [Phycisphaerae bacterium]
MMSELLLGDEAVGLAAIDAGISGMFSYPGTPATEIFEFVQARTRAGGTVAARWSANEKVAYEEALGMSFVGKRALVSMKHVGLNVAADPFMNSALTGAHGALVLAVADDPGMHSSQNEQDSRIYGDFASIPMFEPSNQQEAYDMTREAFELSERFGVPALVRLVTRLAHSRAQVQTSAPTEPRDLDRVENTNDWTLLPVNARRRYRRLLDIQPKLREHSERSSFNRLELKGPKGIITSGIGYNYVREVVGEDSSYSLLKIGTYPVPTRLVRDLINHCEDILCVEEGHPYIETQVNGLFGVPGTAIRGKRDGTIPLDGEMSAERIRTALGMKAVKSFSVVEGLPSRPPRLCDGCPHADTFKAMLEAVSQEESPILFSDIGCYTLGALPPYNAVHSCVDMGSSISMSLGAAKAGAHPVLCTIGDSTFIHSGMTGLIGAAHEDANMTVIILDNATVGMTGGQEIFVTGEDLIGVIRGLGVKEEHLITMKPMAKFHDENVKMLRREINHRGLSVIVACRPCIQVTRKLAQSAKARKMTGTT